MSSSPFSTYRSTIQRELQAGNATEHTHRPALKALIEALDTGITATNEPRRVECGAPDFAISRMTTHGPITVGYIETKDVDVDLAGMERDSERTNPATREGEQLARYRAGIDNLVLTNYLEFRWYVDGKQRMVSSLGHIGQHGHLVVNREAVTTVEELLRSFVKHKAKPVSNPKELAERMARLTRLISNIIVTSFATNGASGTLRGLHKAFAEVLIPDLTESQFADMFAQTLAYGLFAARVNHVGPTNSFRRENAAHDIPRTNPFLRRLFAAIAGPELDEEPFVGFVDDLARLLDETNIKAVLADFGSRTRQEDPIVHFYETFLAAYDPKLREQRGVYYTPEPVVSYITRSVNHLLASRFGCINGLAHTEMVTYKHTNERGQTAIAETPRVLILDPACGTGTFLYSIIDIVREGFMSRGDTGKWSSYVRDQLLPRLFGFELLMAPYAVAHLKLAMQLAAQDLPQEMRGEWAYEFLGNERLGIYLTNTLEEAVRRSDLLLGKYISEEANSAIGIKRDMPIMVILGNPPYSGHSANASTRQIPIPAGALYRRRQGGRWEWARARRDLVATVPTFIGELLDDYYWIDGQPIKERNSKWLQDDYVKFIRFGQWRVGQTGLGILAYITNHGYLDNPTFRGMRQQLARAFTDIYILNLHGDVNKKERCPDGSPDENVFDIEQGVAVGLFVKESGKPGPATVHYADLWGRREAKYAYLSDNSVASTSWTDFTPVSPFYLFVPQNTDFLHEYQHGWRVSDAMPVHSVGIVTFRDKLTIHWSEKEVLDTVRNFVSLSPEEARAEYNLGKDTRDWKVTLAQQDVRTSGVREELLTPVLYRPFDRRFTYYTGRSRGFHSMPRADVMRHMLAGANIGLITNRQVRDGEIRHSWVTQQPVDLHVLQTAHASAYLFPLYCYPAVGGRPNTQVEIQDPSYTWSGDAEGRYPNFGRQFIEEVGNRLRLRFTADGCGDLETAFGPEDVLHYMYAILFSRSYRKRYAEFLKLDFPRIPLTSNPMLFRALALLGSQLTAVHLVRSTACSHPLTRYPVRGDNLVESAYPRYLGPGDPEPGTGSHLERGRVYINGDDPRRGKRGQYFEGVSPEVWGFYVGSYQVCQKWLQDRRGRVLTFEDITHYERIVVAISETIRLMKEIDEAIEEHGGWPIR